MAPTEENRSEHDPYAPQGRVLGPTDDMQSKIGAKEPQPGADEDGFGGDAPEPEAPNDGTVKDLVAEAKDDPELAAEILVAEQELPEDEQRSTLVEKLEPIAAEAVPEGNAGDVMAWVNEGDDPKERAQRALDVESAEDGQGRKGLTNDLNAVLAAE